jgi:hypothetical protein
VNWTPAPTGDGVGRDALIRVNRSGVVDGEVVGGGGDAGADDVVGGAEMGNKTLPFDPALS